MSTNSQIAAAAACIIAAIVSVRMIDAREAVAAAPQSAAADPVLAASARSAPAPASYSARRSDEVRIAAGRNHQFFVTAAVNRRPANFLVDTGASYVTMRDSDARKAGVYTTWKDFDKPVRTANGETMAAFVIIDEIEIGGVSLTDVETFILKDEQLDVNLLGMSFLARLESVETRPGELVLRG